MHEHGIADEILKVLLEEARKRDASGIAGVMIEVGEFSGVTEDALVQGLEHCCEHEDMAPFPVNVVVVGPQGKCQDCGHEAPIEDMTQCPECGGEDIEVQPSTGVRIKSVEFA